jgi:hypothetical protein
VQADGDWDMEKLVNKGDSTDLWAAPDYTECNHLTRPNTRWWDGTGSGLAISNISTSSASMTFDFDLLFDCNSNGIPDQQDIAASTSQDCNADGVPDECQTAFWYVSQSPRLSPIGDGSPQSHVFVSPPPAMGDVILRFEAVGDFAAEYEWVAVDINGTPIGSIFARDADDCPPLSRPNGDGFLVPQDTFEAAVAGGDAVVNMVANYRVDPAECTYTYVRTTLEYLAVGDSCNNNGVPDDCDITVGTSLDCNSNGHPDECDVSGSGVLLDADFESGLPSGWTVSGTFQVTDQCGPASLDCGGTYWAYAGHAASCTYGDDEMGELVAPAVTLGHGLAELHFCSRLESWAGYDFARVRANGTTIWEQSGPATWPQSGRSDAWEEQVVDVSAFAGQSLTITFQFASDQYVSDLLGWQVDNIVLLSGSPDCNATGAPDECEVLGGGDFDIDGDVDLDDYEAFWNCLAGPAATPNPDPAHCSASCLATFDFYADADVDLHDFAGFQMMFSP